MIKRLMHAWEHALLQRDNNRIVRPFEWGVEHWGNHAGGANARQYLNHFVETVLSESDAFFTPSVSPEFSYHEGLLTFSSPVESPYPENNRVAGRFFPAEPNLHPTAAGWSTANLKGRAVIVLPQWNAQPESHLALCRVLNRFGLTALRLSLPYHDERKPKHLERSDYMISPNVGLTIQACRQAVQEARLAADWLTQQGYETLGIIGTSIGSCIAFLTFTHDDRFRVGVFNHASSYFADVVWTGLTTRHVRLGLETQVTLEEIRRFWSVISPQMYVRRLQGKEKKCLVISARYDLSFLPHLTEQFHEEFERCGVPFDKAILPCGHYTSGVFPFSFMDGFLIANYFRKHLKS